MNTQKIDNYLGIYRMGTTIFTRTSCWEEPTEEKAEKVLSELRQEKLAKLDQAQTDYVSTLI